MIDVFISYSKKDRALTKKLAKELEAKGYDVWWDAGLISGESFRNVILSKIQQARAAIIIWTPNSIKSDWVIWEAEQAKDRGIMIPVRLKELRPKLIPPPFGVLHTELVTDLPAVEAALTNAGIIPKPATGPSGGHIKARGFWERRAFWFLAAAAIVIGATAAVYLQYPSSGPGIPHANTKIDWTELPLGSRLANQNPVSVKSFTLADRSSPRSIDIGPGRTIPASGTGGVLSRGIVKQEKWLKFPAGGGQHSHVPEADVKLLLPDQ